MSARVSKERVGVLGIHVLGSAGGGHTDRGECILGHSPSIGDYSSICVSRIIERDLRGWKSMGGSLA